MRKVLILSAMVSFIVFACKSTGDKETSAGAADDTKLLETANSFFQSISSLELQDPDPAKVELGKYLFFDTRLSQTGKISCNSCHGLDTYGVDNKRFSEGDDGSLGNRNSPTVFHASIHKMQFWDGRAKDVEEQAGGPILNPVEHNIKNKEQLVERLKGVEMYQEMFANAFHDHDDPITFDNVTNAIGAFERTLNPESRFDKFLDGDVSQLTEAEKRGLNSFISSGCITCHSGPALGGHMLQKFGLFSDYWVETESENIDNGLFDISNDEADKYFFKVPGLRNIAHTAPYFHDGSVDDLKAVVRIMGRLQRNVDLSDEEVNDIVAFLESLTSDIPEDVKRSPFENI